MKCTLLVCLVSLSLVVTTLGQTPALRRGVRVQEVESSHAVARPEADQDDAWVVAVTADGKLFFEAEEMTANGLWDTMKKTPHRRDAELYVKADARAPFAEVEKVLELARAGYFDRAVLLTSQAQRVAQGSIAPPIGLEVALDPKAVGATLVQVHSGMNGATVKVDGQEVSWTELQNTLASSSGKAALVKADGQTPFADIARAVDACAGAGVKVTLDGMEL